MAAAARVEGSHLLPSQRVSYEEALCFLATPSDVPSGFGKQLEAQQRLYPSDATRRAEARRRRSETREQEEHRLWHTVPVHEDEAGYRLDEEAVIERRMFGRAVVLNCIAALANKRTTSFAPCDDVAAFARATGCIQGAIVVGALRAYEQWGRRSPEKGLAALYAWMRAWNPRLPRVDHDEDSVAQAFRAGKANTARRKAAALLADAEIVLASWVDIWNRKEARHAQ